MVGDCGHPAGKGRGDAMKCPPKPELHYQRQICCVCAAVTKKDAETMCRPSDENWGSSCGAEFDKEGYAVAPTIKSLEAQDAWIVAHLYCGDECVAAKHSPYWRLMAAVIVGPILALIIAAFLGH
jgi:hypothetical protein